MERAESSPIRVMIVDDHALVRDGLAALLRAQPDMVVCGEAGSAAEAVQVAEAMRPDVVLMDVRLSEGSPEATGGAASSGVGATREIRSRLPETAVVMLTSSADEEALFASIMAGASGYMLKQIRGTDLVSTIRKVASGDSLIDPAMTRGLFNRLRAGGGQSKDERLGRLSERERQVLGLIADGRTNRQIGEELSVAEKTVKNHVSQILAKLQVAGRGEAAAYLARHSWSTGD